MVKCNRLITVEMPNGHASTQSEYNLIVPFPVKKMKVKRLCYKSVKNVAAQAQEFLVASSNMVDGPLGFVYDDILVGITTEGCEFEFASPRQFGGRYLFELRTATGAIYPSVAGDHLLMIVEFESE